MNVIKKVTPLALRRFLKKRLPARVITILAAANLISAEPAAPPKKVIKKPIDCPICGTQELGIHENKRTTCAVCGSLNHHRHMALAVYANLPTSANGRTVALGPDPILPLICEDLSRVFHVENLSHLEGAMNSEIDLCIHSDWLTESLFQSEAALARVDSILSHAGKQIFAIDIAAFEAKENGHLSTHHDAMEWFKQNGWPNAVEFHADAVYGKGAAELFGCTAQENDGKAIFVLGKR